MGVDYSATLGYGIALEELPSQISESKWPDEFEVSEWLEANGFKHIQFDCGGNWMSGEYIYLFYMTGTREHLDYRYDEGVRSFDQPSITPEAGIEFKRLCDLIGQPWPQSVSWKLVFNVS